jgi:hypothetical protein
MKRRIKMSKNHESIVELTKRLTDEGKIIEAGWVSLKLMALPDNAPQAQLDDMRDVFFAGAQHLFGSLVSLMDQGEEPTDADMRRMDLIDLELKTFIADFQKKHGLVDVQH